MKKIVIRIILGIILFILVFLLSSAITTAVLKVKAEPKISDFEYAIIFYPDMKTSVEGYIDSWRAYTQNIIEVTLDGTTYVTSSENVLIIKNRTLTLNKEDKDE